MLEAVIFDMDGVLIDSEPFHLEVNRRIFKELGIDISSDEYQTFIGTTHEYMWSRLKEKYGLPQSVGELVDMQVSGNIEYIKNKEIEPIEGVVDLLSEIDEENIKIGVASSSHSKVIELVINKLEIDHYFRAVVSGEDFEEGKPAPYIFLKTAELLNTEPPNCAVVEDSKKGVMAAKAAGMKCIGYNNESSGNQDLSSADLIIDKYSSLKVSILKDLFSK